MIDGDGAIFEGRTLWAGPGHVATANDGNIGIAFLGDYSSTPLSDAQVSSLRTLLGAINEVMGGDLPVYTHGDFNPEKHDELAGARQQIDEVVNGN